MNAPAHPLHPSREQLLYWLHEAAEIEHLLMCCYLYAAFSLKRQDPAWSPEETQAVQRWHGQIMTVAMEEMTHLALVGNLVTALGGTPHFGRPNFPVDSGPYPAGFVIRLAPFCRETIQHFMYLERPLHEQLQDASGFNAATTYSRTPPKGRLSPGARDYATVGELYEVIAEGLAGCAAAQGEAALFVGDAALQVDAQLVPLKGMGVVTDLASAQAAIHTIVTQGEGAGTAVHDSHFNRYCRIDAELAELLARNPAFEPAWPAATHPVMNAPIRESAERVHISHPVQAQWLDIGNALYTTSLRCLAQGFAAQTRADKALWISASYTLMHALPPVGKGLAARPAREGGSQVHAGLSFTALRTLAVLPDASAARVVAERLGQLCERAEALPLDLVPGETEPMWTGVISALRAQRAKLLGVAVPVSAALRSPAPAATPVAAPAPSPVEVARGKAVTIRFDGKRCIHARHCVMDAPRVFLANTPGEWIKPDAMHAEALAQVAHNCPSGAIQCERHDGEPQEAAPEVNQLRIRENGPYAVHAELVLAGQPDGFRATLCRCGQSQNKPWCDGSHNAAEFKASGEPPSGDTSALAHRGGVLAVMPLRDGPLHVHGNLELCAGTGRTVARITEARLCRCGQSANKPFCDLSHVAAGFTAPGQ
jgi:CDGSH-type Zn-finger protein/uncharacterized Fe-S cluster protein YjdI